MLKLLPNDRPSAMNQWGQVLKKCVSVFGYGPEKSIFFIWPSKDLQTTCLNFLKKKKKKKSARNYSPKVSLGKFHRGKFRR